MPRNEEKIWGAGSWLVTHHKARTPKQTIALGNIDLIEVRRPFLGLSATVGLGLWLLAYRFEEELLIEERVTMQTVALVIFAAGFLIGRLKLQSLSLRNEFIFGPIWRLWPMRAAIDSVIDNRRANRSPLTRAPTEE